MKFWLENNKDGQGTEMGEDGRSDPSPTLVQVWCILTRRTHGGRSVRMAECSSRTGLVQTWAKSLERCRILALEKFWWSKFMNGSKTEARSRARSSEWTKRPKSENARSSSDSSWPRLSLARLSVLYCREGRTRRAPVRSVRSYGRGSSQSSFRTCAGRSGTRLGQSVRYGRKSEPRWKCSGRPDLHACLVSWADPRTEAHHLKW